MASEGRDYEEWQAPIDSELFGSPCELSAFDMSCFCNIPCHQDSPSMEDASATVPFTDLAQVPLDFSALPDATPHVPQPSVHQRSLPRRRSKYLLRKSMNGASPIPIAESVRGRDASLALQRWQNSPPEAEAASLSAIYSALQDEPGVGMGHHDWVETSSRRQRGPSSTTSLDSGASVSSIQSGYSSRSATSTASQPIRSTGRNTRRQKARKEETPANRIFKCTFCCDNFKNKYEWARHEKSLHLNMEQWQCAPKGAAVTIALTGRVHCAYCNLLDPTPEHLEHHHHSACQNSGLGPRMFRRKDHLVQHLRLVHRLETLPLIDDWKVQTPPVTSRCGFCDAKLNSWDERSDHLAAHFRKGKTMAHWKGEHGFEPAVSARVTHAHPPYMLAAEALTPVPFSATDPASIDHVKQVASRVAPSLDTASRILGDGAFDVHAWDVCAPQSQQEVDTVEFTDLLSLHLSRFARRQILNGVVPTDEMFQRESRRLLYADGSDDAWDQTIADNPDWLGEFRRQNGYAKESASLSN